MKAIIINRGFKNLFSGFQQTFRRGQYLENILQNEPEFFRLLIQRIRNTDRTDKFTYELKDRNFEIVITKIPDNYHRKYSITFQDVTIREETEEIRKKFVSNVTHELRTPLAAISSISEIMVYQDGITKEEYKENAEIIYNEIQRLSKMVTQLLEVSKYDQNRVVLDYEVFEIQNLFNDLEKLYTYRAESGNIKLVFEENDVYVRADYDKLKQVLINLIENALLYSKGNVNLFSKLKNKKVRITVQDNGIGLTYDQKERIFGRFIRTDESRARNSGGAGLGLSIVRDIVEAHGGEIYVQSELEVGSEFIIELPM